MSENINVTSIGVQELIDDFLARYGGKGRAVLFAAVEAMIEIQRRSEYARLGDFDYKTLREMLERLGGGVNPTNYLRALEREYGIVNQTYRSTRQQWWSFANKEAILSWYERQVGKPSDDPVVKVLVVKYRVLKPEEKLSRLEALSRKPSLSLVEQKEIMDFVFNELDKVLLVLNEIKKYGDVFRNEVNVLSRIIDLAYQLSSRI
uniref:Uncharacterized protein n=1 Tax=Fervidicoccus fontis TaxID=683846 RepID=A0A7C1E431_9CREN